LESAATTAWKPENPQQQLLKQQKVNEKAASQPLQAGIFCSS
jgi:hypothetical protein